MIDHRDTPKFPWASAWLIVSTTLLPIWLLLGLAFGVQIAKWLS